MSTIPPLVTEVSNILTCGGGIINNTTQLTEYGKVLTWDGGVVNDTTAVVKFVNNTTPGNRVM